VSITFLKSKIIMILSCCVLFTNAFAGDNDNNSWSVRMAESTITYGTYQSIFEYVSATAMKAFCQLWQTTGEDRYFQYIKGAVESDLTQFHNITNMKGTNYIDPVNGGTLILMMYSQTKQEKYKTAIDSTLEYLITFDRSTEGGFFHKHDPRMQIDDLYMEGEFLAEYAEVFDRTEELDEALRQTGLMEKYMRDPATGLWSHAWFEEATNSFPAGPTPFFWGRGMGWAAMAIVDMLDWWPAEHAGRDSLIGIFQRYAQALANVQDESTGVWWQILDMPGHEGNWLESSGSCMFVYSLAKGVRLGYIDESYWDIVEKGYQGILNQFIRENTDSTITITNVCPGQAPSVLYSSYVRTPYENGHSVGPFIMASLEIEAATTSVREIQSVIPKTISLSNYPNPFNAQTNIVYSLPKREKVKLTVYNFLGQEIKTLVDQVKSAGKYTVHFDASKLSSGVYTCKLLTESAVVTRKMLYVK
jgi:unsaturated rhamnogalacturonyl hydrolase